MGCYLTSLAAVLFLTFSLFSGERGPLLRAKEPHWRPTIVETYPEGQPMRVVYVEELEGGELKEWKQVTFYATGQIQEEVDLVRISKEAPAFSLWNKEHVPHGASLVYYPNGALEKIAYFTQGLLDGQCTLYFPDGKERLKCTYKEGKFDGPIVAYFEDGTKSKEGCYKEGKLHGDLIQYFSKGGRSSLVTYLEGVPHGSSSEWYENGVLKASRHYHKGLLHSDGKNPAVILYNEERGIQEAQDFKQ